MITYRKDGRVEFAASPFTNDEVDQIIDRLDHAVARLEVMRFDRDSILKVCRRALLEVARSIDNCGCETKKIYADLKNITENEAPWEKNDEPKSLNSGNGITGFD